jgi:hypothetical protein
MAEWVPVLSLIVAGLGVVIGPLVAWRVARARNALDASQAAEQRRHEAVLAAEQRRQERLAALYVDLIAYAWFIRDWADRTKPIISGAGDPPPPPPPDDVERRRLTARLQAFGSRDIRGKLVALSALASRFESAVAQLDFEEQNPGRQGPTRWGELRREIDETRKEIRVAVDELGDAVNGELSSGPRSPSV